MIYQLSRLKIHNAGKHGSTSIMLKKVSGSNSPKKGSGIPSVNYAEALEVALCYGWIDAQKASFDEQYWLQKFTPRGSKSIWSKVNCDKVTTLIAQGRMQPAGLQHIERAKADGRWDASYDPQSTITVPPDLQSELDNNQAAKDFSAH